MWILKDVKIVAAEVSLINPVLLWFLRIDRKLQIAQNWKKFHETKKPAANTRSCQKVVQQLVGKPFSHSGEKSFVWKHEYEAKDVQNITIQI